MNLRGKVDREKASWCIRNEHKDETKDQSQTEHEAKKMTDDQQGEERKQNQKFVRKEITKIILGRSTDARNHGPKKQTRK